MFFSSQRQPARMCPDNQAVHYFYEQNLQMLVGVTETTADLKSCRKALNDCDEKALKIKGQKNEIMGREDRKNPKVTDWFTTG